MQREELIKLLQFDEDTGYESKIYIPNEIFDDLKNNNDIKSPAHKAFSYCYIYLATWLYRYAKHNGIIEATSSTKEGTISMKEILGYNQMTKGLDYLIKKNGVLEEMGYLSTVKDYPISAMFEDGYLEFSMLSDLDVEMQKYVKNRSSRKYTIKFPVKAFYRFDDNDEDGTFYFIDNTTLIPFEVFLFCMSNEKLGCEAFYLYSYLQYKNQIFEGGYDVSIENLALETGLNIRTLKNYLHLLKGYKMIQCMHNQDFFALGLIKEKRKANTYITNDSELFFDELTTYKKIKVMPRKEYLLKLKFEKEEEIKKWEATEAVNIPIEQLPF
ncbi:hypothetical protein ABE65_010445 [Fictibacillus phosphorivorans]|uniref:Uncharacterized protein n=1 Tax=Fictibacillus phosphorivorans TaxID=1221500 RepID=A0A168W067_9BACL|nr:hypothetical protein [Fictibacillus phosphorivorans]ANC77199.1 hypothetical protein ABE65_010445 [Fictibacillus phosphorivorans]